MGEVAVSAIVIPSEIKTVAIRKEIIFLHYSMCWFPALVW